MRQFGAVLLVATLVAVQPGAVQGASAFANPSFQQQWQTGEAIVPNFLGPLATAKDGQQEPYKDAAGGIRLVEYFDKGRMELTNGTVTNGLLATEIVTGQVQVGDAIFQPKAAPAIPIAGDPDNAGPTYAALDGKAAALLQPATRHTPTERNLGAIVEVRVAADGALTPPSVVNAGSGPMAISAYDDPTKHNVPQAFAEYRAKAGLGTIGYAIAEPFLATVKVAGTQKAVMIQPFERRVLTYTADNPAAFRVEMGNIGQHYYRWRYGDAAPAAVVPPSPQSPPMQPPLAVPSAVGSPGNLYNCADFPSQAAAQAYLRQYPSDLSWLDADNDGIACESRPMPYDRTPVKRA